MVRIGKSKDKLKRKNVGTCEVEASKKQKISSDTPDLCKGKDECMKGFMEEVRKAIVDSTKAAPDSPGSKYKIAFKLSAQVLYILVFCLFVCVV